MIKSSLFVNLLDAPFSRRGSYLAFANNNNGEDLYGKCTLWLCNCRTTGGMTDLNASNFFRQVKLELTKDGQVLPCVISTTPYEIILESMYGSVRFVIGERKLVMCRGESGLGLRITPTPRMMGRGSIDMMDGTWLIDFRATRLLLIPFNGKLSDAQAGLDMYPDEDGIMQLGFEEYYIEPVHRPIDEYPSYAQCVESVREDFDSFCAKVMPSLPEKYEGKRLQALWQTWNMIVEPDGEGSYKHSMVKMIHSIFEAAFVWQQPKQAVWLSGDPVLAWDIFQSCFDHQDENGRITDALGFTAQPSTGLKPSVHGLTLLWLMDNGILGTASAESKVRVWEGLEKWTSYLLNFRDKDGDGIVEFQNILETGWEDAPYFNVGFPCASPDLSAMLVLQMEALARLGRDIGKPEQECAAWEKRATELVGKIVEKFWDGERWFAFNPVTGKRSDSSTLPLYLGLLLGKRLPEEIIEKSIAYIFGPNGFDTPYGLASESVNSVYFAHGFTKGSVITPAQYLMVEALEACGRSDLAKDVANKYCAILRDHGFFHIHNALTGKEDRSLTAFGERGLFWSAWASSCYIYFASRYGD